jgi:hypothetical protein
VIGHYVERYLHIRKYFVDVNPEEIPETSMDEMDHVIHILKGEEFELHS